jgi:hypothetical protein
VGRLHWETDDEFSHFSSYSPPLDTLVAVVETAAAPDGTNVTWVRGLIMIWGMVSVALLVGRRLHGKKGRHGKCATKRKKKDRRDTTNSIFSIKKPKQCDKGDPVAAAKQLHNTGAASVEKLRSETCAGNESDERTVQVTSMLTDTSLPKTNGENDNDVVELVHLAKSPTVIVADSSEATDTTYMTVSASCNPCTLGLPSLDNDSIHKALLFTDRTVSMVSHRSIVATAEDANALAQKIRVTQAVFSSHGLDPNLASEWVMRRQESDLSVCRLHWVYYMLLGTTCVHNTNILLIIRYGQEASRRKLEDCRFVMDTIQRHEDRQVLERQFREMRASTEYDNDWLEKTHKGTSTWWTDLLIRFLATILIAYNVFCDFRR